MLPPTNSQRACRICGLASTPLPRHAYDRAWTEDELYFALVSVGALVPGWSLVFPKSHSLNLSLKYTEDSLWDFVGRAHSVVEARYGSSVIFEHGSQDDNSLTGCGTSHAHLHIVPLKKGLISAAEAFDSTVVWAPCSAREIGEVVAGREYLFVADDFRGAETIGKLAILSEGRSQFFRRVIASTLGRQSEFDYREHPQIDIANASANQLLGDAMQLLQVSAA